MKTDRTEAACTFPKKTQRCRSGMLLVVLLGVAVLGLSAIDRPAYAEDELYLTGVIKTVNPVTGVVYVEVLSSSCHGMRIFRADQPEKLENFIEQKISFFIDSNRCRDDAVHTMLVSRGVMK